MKFQIIFLVICLIAAAVAKFQCKEGVPYKENDCNNCRCGGGVLACTFKLCPTPKSNELRNCVTGTEWKDGCNDCVCDEELKTICTNNPC